MLVVRSMCEAFHLPTQIGKRHRCTLGYLYQKRCFFFFLFPWLFSVDGLRACSGNRVTVVQSEIDSGKRYVHRKRRPLAVALTMAWT